MLGRTIQMLLKWGRRPRFTFYLAKWYWDSYPFSRRVRHHHLMKHWIPCDYWWFKGMWGPLSRSGGHLRLSLGSPQGIQTCLHLVRWKMSLNLIHCREIGPSLSQGIWVSIPLETENKGSLSQRYCWGKTPPEVLVESWLTSSVQVRESDLILGRYGVHGALFELLYWN